MQISYAENHEDADVADEIRANIENQDIFFKSPVPRDWNKLNKSRLMDYVRTIDQWASLTPENNNSDVSLGIGARLYTDRDNYWLLPYQNGPLMNSGVTKRIQLLSIDGQKISHIPINEVADKFAKPMGQPLELDFCLNSSACDEIKKIKVTNQPYVHQSVDTVDIMHHHAIRIFSFDDNTPKLLYQLMNSKVQPDLNPAFGTVIIDLRDNEGGNLFSAIEALDMFLLPDDEILTLVDKHGENTVFRAKNIKSISHNFPLLLLTSNRTASSGEIFAGVLQQYGIALIIGEKTYGKCVSQTQKKLSNGEYLKFTNIKVFLPDNVSCNEKGISPQFLFEGEKLFDSDQLSKVLGRFMSR